MYKQQEHPSCSLLLHHFCSICFAFCLSSLCNFAKIFRLLVPTYRSATKSSDLKFFHKDFRKIRDNQTLITQVVIIRTITKEAGNSHSYHRNALASSESFFSLKWGTQLGIRPTPSPIHIHMPGDKGATSP